MTTPPPVPVQSAAPAVRVAGVSRWYGEVLGINKVTVDIHPGITGLVGPNGSGKSTLMNIICGLIRPGQGGVTIHGRPVWNNPELRRLLGYCSQVDHFYEGFTGREFLESMLRLHGRGRAWARRAAGEALEQVGLGESANRRIRGYSKGMRQRVKIGLAIAHQPRVLVLDEPFNGLDPVGRREMMRLLEDHAREGRSIILSSHILHEIEQMTENILMMSNGYVVAEGQVRQVRDLLRSHPFKVFIACADARALGGLLLREPSVAGVELEDAETLSLTTRDPDGFYLYLNEVVLAHAIELRIVTLADENVQSIYQYLASGEHH